MSADGRIECAVCSGTGGVEAGPEVFVCALCGGSGFVYHDRLDGLCDAALEHHDVVLCDVVATFGCGHEVDLTGKLLACDTVERCPACDPSLTVVDLDDAESA